MARVSLVFSASSAFRRLVILRRITKGSDIKNRTEAAILLTREWRKKIRIRKLEAKVTKANAA